MLPRNVFSKIVNDVWFEVDYQNSSTDIDVYTLLSILSVLINIFPLFHKLEKSSEAFTAYEVLLDCY